MDKQKQIEEMAACLIGKVVTGADSTKVLNLGYITVKEIASILANAGYRKIPENAVVLTSEELAKRNAEIEIIKIDNDTYLKEAKRVCELELKARIELEELKRNFDYNLVQERKQIRKETAEKFVPLRKYITEQFHHYLDIRYKCERDCKKFGDELTKLVMNNDWHRADAIMFILEKIGDEFDEICKEITEGKA
jgi:hypothetical protein